MIFINFKGGNQRSIRAVHGAIYKSTYFRGKEKNVKENCYFHFDEFVSLTIAHANKG